MNRAKFKSVDKIMWTVVENDGTTLPDWLCDLKREARELWMPNSGETVHRVRVRITPAPARRKGRK